MRVEFDPKDFDIPLEDFGKYFSPVAEAFAMTPVVVVSSGGGDAIDRDEIERDQVLRIDFLRGLEQQAVMVLGLARRSQHSPCRVLRG